MAKPGPKPRLAAGSEEYKAAIKFGNDLFDEGASQAEVAKTLGYSDNWVRIHFPGRKLTPEETRERIIIAQQERRIKEKEDKGRYAHVSL